MSIWHVIMSMSLVKSLITTILVLVARARSVAIVVHQLVPPTMIPYVYQFIQGFARIWFCDLTYTWQYLAAPLLLCIAFYWASR